MLCDIQRFSRIGSLVQRCICLQRRCCRRHAGPAISLGRSRPSPHSRSVHPYSRTYCPIQPSLKLSASVIHVIHGLLPTHRSRKGGRLSWPGWLTTWNRLPTKWLALTCQPQIGRRSEIERRSGKVRRPKTKDY